jgi:hypothetical protein
MKIVALAAAWMRNYSFPRAYCSAITAGAFIFAVIILRNY